MGSSGPGRVRVECVIYRQPNASEPVRIGPAQMEGAYVIEVGMFPPGQPGPPLHLSAGRVARMVTCWRTLAEAPRCCSTARPR
jgi:hypothetical protein